LHAFHSDFCKHHIAYISSIYSGTQKFTIFSQWSIFHFPTWGAVRSLFAGRIEPCICITKFNDI
jgi:hypothetical protein